MGILHQVFCFVKRLVIHNSTDGLKGKNAQLFARQLGLSNRVLACSLIVRFKLFPYAGIVELQPYDVS